jgi:hypothetical protein
MLELPSGATIVRTLSGCGVLASAAGTRPARGNRAAFGLTQGMLHMPMRSMIAP